MNTDLSEPDKAEEKDIRTEGLSQPADIRDVKIDPELPLQERMESFLEQIKNPYRFTCGKVLVTLSFDEDSGVSLEEQFTGYLRSLL